MSGACTESTVSDVLRQVFSGNTSFMKEFNFASLMLPEALDLKSEPRVPGLPGQQQQEEGEEEEVVEERVKGQCDRDDDETRQRRRPLTASLQAVLRDLGFPPLRERSVTSQHPAEAGDVTVVLTGDLGACLPVFFEGNRQSPGSFVMVMTSAWLSRDTASWDPDTHVLYVLQGITGDKGGVYLDHFHPHRRVTCLLDLKDPSVDKDCDDIDVMTTSMMINDRSAADDISASFSRRARLETPISGTRSLQQISQSRLLSRLLFAQAGVLHPLTLALVPTSYGRYDAFLHDLQQFPTTLKVNFLNLRDLQLSVLDEIVRDFVSDARQRTGFDHVTVEPICALRGHSCPEVKVSLDVSEITESILHLLDDLEAHSGVLVGCTPAPLQPAVRHGMGRRAVNVEGTSLALGLTAYVHRTPFNNARLSQVLGEIRSAGTSRCSPALPTDLPHALRRWGLDDVRQHDVIAGLIRKEAEATMLELLKKERLLQRNDQHGAKAKTDVIAVEFRLTTVDHKVTPVALGLLPACQHLRKASLYQGTLPRAASLRATSGLVRTLLTRSQRFLMRDRRVVVVGGGQFNKRHILDAALDLGVKIVLVDQNPEHPYKSKVEHFVCVPDMLDTALESHTAHVIVDKIKRWTVGKAPLHGCLTFLGAYVSLTSLVAEGLNLRRFAPSHRATTAARVKLQTLQLLGEATQLLPHALPTAAFASPVVHVRSVADLKAAVAKVPLPAVLKPESGMSARGVRHVSTLREAEEHVRCVKEMHEENEAALAGDLILMKKVVGTEHSVDIVMFEGRLVAAFVVDKGPTYLPKCCQTASVMPSLLREEEERGLTMAAAQCVLGLGLHTGVFNLDMMMTALGPRLLEVNARMGGFYIYHWIRHLYDIDLAHLAIMAACGVRPDVPNTIAGVSSSAQQREETHGVLMGLNLWPHRHRRALTSTATPEHLQRLHERGAVLFTQLQRELTSEHEVYEIPFGNVAVRGRTAAEARSKLVAVCESLELETAESMQEVLCDFDCENH